MSGIARAGSSFAKVKYSCKYPSCKNSYSINLPEGFKNPAFFRFPQDSDSIESWKKACNISPSKNCANFRVCRDHFALSDFNNPDDPSRLRKGAFPWSPLKFKLQREHSYASKVEAKDLFSEPASISNISEKYEEAIVEPSCSHQNLSTISEEQDEAIVEPSCSQQNLVTEGPMSNPASGSSCSKMNCNYFDKYSFLLEKRTGILGKAGLTSSDLSPEQEAMYKVHRNVTSKLSKLKSLLKNERAHVTSLKNLYNDGRFTFIEENLNQVTKDFINCQLKNANKPPTGRRWSFKDKAFALSVY